MRLMSLIEGLAIGACAMYALDPQSGRRRQSMVRDRIERRLKVKRDALEVMRRDFANRSRGMATAARSKAKNDFPPDMVLRDRVKSSIGRVVTHPKALRVDCASGQVTLSGPVLIQEVRGLIGTVKGVRGVTEVLNNLEVYEGAGTVPSLQGEGHSHPSDRWTPATCFVALCAGGALTVYGLARRGVVGTVASVAGSALIGRAFHDTETRGTSVTPTAEERELPIVDAVGPTGL